MSQTQLSDDAGDRKTIRLWDLPVRIVHWSFVLLIPALWWTGEERELDWHVRIGLVMLALVLFRLLWGLFGSRPARFAGFLKGPKAVIAYLRGSAPPVVGHNPIGGWSVLSMLGLLSSQIGLGLFASDTDGLHYGPLSSLIADYETVEAITKWHETLFNLLLALIVVHVGAILYHVVRKRENLVTPMVTGEKDVESDIAQPVLGSSALALTFACVATAISWWVSLGAPLPGA